MARKEKLHIHRDEDLTEIDLELDHALAQLENSNERVVELLRSIEGQQADPAEACAMPAAGDMTANAPAPETPESSQ